MSLTKKEVWLRGIFLDDITPILQPVGNALLQAAEEIEDSMHDFPDEKLWKKPADCAAVAFHLKHIPGFLDRLSTYADGNMLTEKQLQYLQQEEIDDHKSTEQLTENTIRSIHRMIEKLKTFPENSLTEKRYVGRTKIPTTTIGLLFHAAEHTMRHTGQLLVTTAILKKH